MPVRWYIRVYSHLVRDRQVELRENHGRRPDPVGDDHHDGAGDVAADDRLIRRRVG